MSILIGIGVVATITTFYLGKKGWHAFHKAVGISPGVLTYQDYHAPLSPATISWQQLNLNKTHLKNLPEHQLRQLNRIDEKVEHYQSHQKELQAQNKTVVATESQFVLHKMLQTRLPETLSSYHQLTHKRKNTKNASREKNAEAGELLQQVLDNIEQRLDKLLAQMEHQHLQDLRMMNQYFESHDS
ncbi:hypothetical protein AAJP47_10855 [Psychrobacter sp. B38]|uniref:hypothetical protein n=1 Tax=Psychrobacter sp. B38 TaxID=3143538 RepID=UPI00320D0C5B